MSLEGLVFLSGRSCHTLFNDESWFSSASMAWALETLGRDACGYDNLLVTPIQEVSHRKLFPWKGKRKMMIATLGSKPENVDVTKNPWLHEIDSLKAGAFLSSDRNDI